jgi:hypothetical protein
LPAAAAAAVAAAPVSVAHTGSIAAWLVELGVLQALQSVCSCTEQPCQRGAAALMMRAQAMW